MTQTLGEKGIWFPRAVCALSGNLRVGVVTDPGQVPCTNHCDVFLLAPDPGTSGFRTESALCCPSSSQMH